MTGTTTEILWYIARDGQQHGPISETEMQLFVDNRHLRPSDLLWRPGFADWRAATDVFPGQIGVKPEPPRAGQNESAPAAAPASDAPSASPAAPEAQAAASPSKSTGAQGTPTQGTSAAAAPAANGPRGSAGPQRPSTHQPTAQPAGPQSGRGASGPQGAPTSRMAQPGMADFGAPAAPYEPALANDDNHYADEPRSGGYGKRVALAAVLIALIVGSFIYIVTQKDEIMALMGLGSSAKDVPVVKAEVPVASAPKQTAALQRPENPAPAAAPAPETAAPQPAQSGQQARSSEPPPGSSETAARPNAADPQLATESTITPTATTPANDMAMLDAYYQKSKLWQYLKRSYPDWYSARINEASKQGSGSAPSRDVTKGLVQGLVALRREHASDALQADTGMLKAIATAFLNNLQALSETSADACYGFISQGETSTKSVDLFHQPQSAPALETQALTIFQAIAAGKAAPAKHERPQKGDYDTLAAELGKLGWSQADLQLFADPKALSTAPPARVCSMVRDWFKAHIAISDAAVQERLLFETLRPVVSG